MTVHDMTNFLFPEWYPARNNAYRKRMLRRGIQNARAVIAVSRSTARDIEKLFPGTAGRVRVIPEGVHPRFSPDAGAKIVTLPEICRDPFVLFVGTLSPRKNMRRLIEAFELLSEKTSRPGLRLVLAGMRGWMSDDILTDLKDSGPEGRVHHAGFVSGEVLAEMYRRSALVCLPSLYEGFGLPALEAMASGTPVLVSNRSSLPELAADEACLADPKDTEDLAEKMARLLDDEPLRRRVRQAGLEKVRDFTWEKAAAETLRVYREVV
jgi:glycosyltransferase involved in cell wall biosynthesis